MDPIEDPAYANDSVPWIPALFITALFIFGALLEILHII